MIRKSDLKDIEKMMEIISSTIQEMHSYNNTQWDNEYPTKNDFKLDIENENLYVDIEDSGEIMGFICINDVPNEEYDELKWSRDDKYMVLHRMAVNPNFRKQGVASRLMSFAEEFAIKNDIYYLKADTYSLNTKMNSLFKNLNYKFVGQVKLLEKEEPFNYYEKILN